MKFNFIVLFLMSCTVMAQDNKNTTDQQLDLQEFVITGKTNADIKGGLKMKPSKPGTLSRAELDSINTDVKIPVPLLPSVPLPSSALKTYSVQGYVMGEFGIFVTPNMNTGYSFSSGGYIVDVFGNYERSSGHVDNADYTKAGISLRASYDAPKKFVFFGGSRTESGLSYSNRAFQLFGVDRQFMFERSINDAGAHVDVKGVIGEYSYAMGAQWQSLSIATTGATFLDSRIKGFADVTMPLFDMPITTSLLVDLHSYDADSDYNFIQGGALTNWTSGDVSIRGGAGLQSAVNSQGVQFGAFSLQGDIDYRLSSDFTANMRIRSGLNNTSLSEMLTINPYLINKPVISFRRDDIDISQMLQWHPTTDLSSSLNISYRSSSNIPIMVPNSTEIGKFSGFDIQYISGTIIVMRFETQWKAWGHSTIGGFASYTHSAQADKDIVIPMIAPLTIGLRYERMWSGQLQSIISVEHIGSRTIDKLGSQEIPSYIMANARLNYTIQKDFEAYLRISNILNASVYLWNRFRERGTFVALGARYLF